VLDFLAEAFAARASTLRDVPDLDADSLVLCSGTLRRAPLVETVRAASAAGFDGVSLYHREYVAARDAGWSDSQLRSLLDGEGVAVAELDGVMRWLPGDAHGPSLAEFVAAASELGARSVTALETRGRTIGAELALEAASDAFAALCDHAAEAGLLVHIEYFPTSGIADLGTAVAVSRGAGRANGGVMCDLWHHVRGPDGGAAAFDGAAVVAVQVGDVAPVASCDVVHEMMHGRRLPGEGAADLVGLLRALRASGCVAPIEVEVYSDELAALEPVDAARRAHAALTRQLERAGLR